MSHVFGIEIPNNTTNVKNVMTTQARSQGGSGGSADPPLRTKGPLFGTSREKLLRPITING